MADKLMYSSRFLYLLLFSVISIISATFLYGESEVGDGFDFKTADSGVEAQQAYVNTDSVNTWFMHQKNYIPGEPLNKAIKTIYLAFNIWQDDNGEGNFQDDDVTHERMYEMVERLNNIFSKSAYPTQPVEGVEYQKDSHIRFELKDIGFYQNSALHSVNCGSGRKLNEYVFEREPHKQKYLNIHFTEGNCRGASGYANYPSGRNLEQDGYVVSFVKYHIHGDAYPFWALMLHVAHEIGHVLELRHPYDSEYCKFSHPDFLFDLFGYERQNWCENIRPNCDVCYHDGGFDCDLTDPGKTCTNNLMGGNSNSTSITPLQMGRMNRSLSLKSARKYAWGYSDIPFVIEFSQEWEFNTKFYQDILVTSGNTLYLRGKLEMVPEAFIIIEPGAEVIVDSGRITNALNSAEPWQGFIIQKSTRKWYHFFKKKLPDGKVVLTNDGLVENYVQ
jgi:hypothetical protein